MDLSRSELPNPPPAAAVAGTDASIVPADAATAAATAAPLVDAFRLLQAGPSESLPSHSFPRCRAEPARGLEAVLVTKRPRELTGAVDLVAHYGLREQHERFCGRPLPASVAEAGHLRRVAGDVGLRRGDGLELAQLLVAREAPPALDAADIRLLELEDLHAGLALKETDEAVSLPESERGEPAFAGLPPAAGEQEAGGSLAKVEEQQGEEWRERHRDKDREGSQRHKSKRRERHKDRHKDSGGKDRNLEHGENGKERGQRSKKKKRKREAGENKEATVPPANDPELKRQKPSTPMRNGL
eukprot:SM000198S05318  [mRNA]  locus=s198:208916:210482:+ [translate_table: standard]